MLARGAASDRRRGECAEDRRTGVPAEWPEVREEKESVDEAEEEGRRRERDARCTNLKRCAKLKCRLSSDSSLSGRLMAAGSW
jgi:hypothetical protein